MAEDRHFHVEDRGGNRGAEQTLISNIVGVCYQSNAGRQQFRSGRIDNDFAMVCRTVKLQLVISAWLFAVF